MKNTREIAIPFSGFYESIHSHTIDDAINTLFDEDGDGEPDFTEKQVEDFWGDYNPRGWGIEKAYCKEYVKFIAEEFEVPLEFVEVASPREYNFATDRIFARITLDDAEKLFKAVDKNALQKRIKKCFTSYDGFISHYSNNLEDWLEKPIEEWDHNELGMLLAVQIESQLGNLSLDSLESELAWKFVTACDVCELISFYIPDHIFNKYATTSIKGGN